MFGPTPCRDILVVAGFELREMRRSRRALAVVALYLMVAAFLAYFFVHLLEQAQTVVTNPVALMQAANGPGPGGPGGPRGRGGPVFAPSPPDKPSQGLFFSRRSPFRAVLRNQVSDDETMDFLVVQPPIALYYLLTSFMFVPFLIMITASETVAQEHQSRGVRFVAMRTGRAELVLGKVLGQGLLVAVVTLLAGLMSLTVAAWNLADFAWGPALSALLLFWPRVVAYTVPFVGLASLCSMSTNSTMAARAAALLGLGGLWLVHQAPTIYAISPLAARTNGAFAPVFNTLDYISPYAYQDDLWRPLWSEIGTPILLLAWLGIIYVGVGLFFYRRRDL